MRDDRHSHRAFPQPSDEGTTLWRYMDARKFEWLVVCQRLLMPNADRLGDPREGTTPPGDLEWWQREAANADNNDLKRVIEHNRNFLSRMAHRFRREYYVSCWHMNQYESRAMWDCYTPGTTDAVAIKTTYGALRDCLPPYVRMGVVRYIDYASERLPTMNMFEYIMHKDIYYSFEREVRAVVLRPVVEVDQTEVAEHFRANHFVSESQAGFLVYAPQVDLQRLIHGLVLHPEASAKFQSSMATLCVKNDLPTPEASRRTREPVF